MDGPLRAPTITVVDAIHAKNGAVLCLVATGIGLIKISKKYYLITQTPPVNQILTVEINYSNSTVKLRSLTVGID